MPHANFFTLPRELRDEVYYLATGTGLTLTIEVQYRSRKHEVCCRAPGLDTALLGVNKQIHQEAAEALYSQNRFVIDCPSTFLAMIGPANASYLRHAQFDLTDLSLYQYTHANRGVMPKSLRERIREAIITRCTGLRTLEVAVPLLSSFYARNFPECVPSIDEVARELPSLQKRVIIIRGKAEDASSFRPMLKPAKELGWVIRRVNPYDSTMVEEDYDFEEPAAQANVNH